MYMKRIALLLLLAWSSHVMGQTLAEGREQSGKSTPADYVNPMIGASTNVEKAGAYHGLGKTFPEPPRHTA